MDFTSISREDVIRQRHSCFNNGEFFSAPSDEHDIIVQKTAIGARNMSLIITMKTTHGIVFASDSKSTYINQEKSFYEQEHRTAQKVFQFARFILTTYGRNECFVNGVLYYIEDVINEILSAAPGITMHDFILALRDRLEVSLYRDVSDPYCFIFGYKAQNMYVIEYVQIYRDRIVYNPQLKNCIGWVGDTTCFPEKLQFQLNQNWSISDMENGIRMLMQNAIAVGDLFLNYNPVGGDVQIVSFTNETPENRLR